MKKANDDNKLLTTQIQLKDESVKMLKREVEALETKLKEL